MKSAFTAIPEHRLPVILAGARTPFLDSAGLYAELMSYELGAHALRGLLDRSDVDPARIELVIMGTVLHEIETTNVAREAMLAAAWDSDLRTEVIDGDGVAAEVVFPDADAVDSRTAAPFGVGLGLSGDHDPELGLAVDHLRVEDIEPAILPGWLQLA